MIDRIEIARRLFGAFNRLNVEETLQLCSADVEVSTIISRLHGFDPSGREGLRQGFEYLAERWAFLEASERDAEEHGDWAVLSGRARGRGKGSPDEIEYDWVVTIRVRDDGLVDRVGIYLTREEAMRAIEAG